MVRDEGRDKSTRDQSAFASTYLQTLKRPEIVLIISVSGNLVQTVNYPTSRRKVTRAYNVQNRPGDERH